MLCFYYKQMFNGQPIQLIARLVELKLYHTCILSFLDINKTLKSHLWRRKLVYLIVFQLREFSLNVF